MHKYFLKLNNQSESLPLPVMADLSIIRASAGSGKTFRLTASFLKIIMTQNEEYFKHILAVTFTNKATAEMKSRIIKELYLLGYNMQSDHLLDLIKETGKKEDAIRKKSKDILNHILHGYSWFRIETIDTFFQKIIRSFIHELGIPGNYSIELNQDLILEEAINRFLDNLGTDNDIVNWLIEYLEKKISEGKSWKINNELQNIGRSLFKEIYLQNSVELENVLSDEQKIKDYHTTLNSILKNFENTVTLMAEKAVKSIVDTGFSIIDFAYDMGGPAGYFYKLLKKDYKEPGKRFYSGLEDSSVWVKKTSPDRQAITRLAEEKLIPAALKILEYFKAEQASYNSALAILKNLHILRLLNNISIEISNIKQEKGLFLIGESATFISRIINHNDTPFIYEKVGNYIHHLLIDEFQDTSDLQYQNFKPLISNSLSQQYSCFVVGDIKQSIYRWRNSNWEILANQIKTEFSSGNPLEITLDTNWRSTKEVIEFNNTFFMEAATIFGNMAGTDNTGFIPLEKVYEDTVQNYPNKKTEGSKGYVEIKIFEHDAKKNNENYFGTELTDTINKFLELGYLPGDIVFLVRKKGEGSLLANFLINANKEKKFVSNVGVISNESLFLESSPIIKLLISALKYVYSPDIDIYGAELLASYLHAHNSADKTIFPAYEFNQSILDKKIKKGFTDACKHFKSESLYDIVDLLIHQLDIDSLTNEIVYLHSFQDIIFEFSTKESSDLAAFLEFWENEGASKTISAAETSDSIRILTIHKSKGLEFPIVIVPFCDWGFKPHSNDLLWLKPGIEPFNALPLVAVPYSSALENSIFIKDYQKENYLSLIDNLNLLYVAFTRAEKALIGYSIGANKSISTVGHAIEQICSKMAIDSTINLLHKPENNKYILGALNPKVKKNAKNTSLLFNAQHQTTNKPDIKISQLAFNYISGKDGLRNAANFGKLLHSIMEIITSKSDIVGAVRKFILNGIISEEDGKEITELILEAFNNPIITEWFSDKYIVLTETDIIGTGGQVKRPDRVLINNEKAVVIDYKFGSEEDKIKHKKQVSNYIKLLSDMGYQKVEGYIWYVLEKDILEV